MKQYEFQSVEVENKFHSYPASAQDALLGLRALIFSTAEKEIKESLKWGEPSYTCKHGSPIRMDYKPAKPEQYAIYFNCKSKLIDTFKELHPNKFCFEGNRALILKLNEAIDEQALKHCLSLALNYHKIKHLPLLGA